MTSGNMGAGLAVVCAALGHPLVVTMSAGNSPQRARMLEALGAEVILVPQVAGEPGSSHRPDIEAAARIAEHLAAERGGFYVDQFNAPEGKAAHEIGTARELLDAANGSLDGWTACVGTGCTFLGVARALRTANPSVVCAAATCSMRGNFPANGVDTPAAQTDSTKQGLGLSCSPGRMSSRNSSVQ